METQPKLLFHENITLGISWTLYVASDTPQEATPRWAKSTSLCAARGSIAAPWPLPSSRSGTSSAAASPAHASGSRCTRASACLSAASLSKQPVPLWKKFLFSQTDTGYDPEKENSEYIKFFRVFL